MFAAHPTNFPNAQKSFSHASAKKVKVSAEDDVAIEKIRRRASAVALRLPLSVFPVPHIGDWREAEEGFSSWGILTSSEHREGAVVVQPLQGGLVELRLAGRGHRVVEGLKQGLDDDAELEQ